MPPDRRTEYLAYAIDDYVQAIRHLTTEGNVASVALHEERQRIEGVKQFIQKEIERLRKKLDFFASRSPQKQEKLESQLSLLNKILHKFES